MNDGGSEVPTIPRREPTALATVPANDGAQLMSIIERAATDPAFDVEKMRAMLDMKRDWDAMTARRAYAEAMTAAQSEMRPVVRERENKQQGSMYAALEDIHERIKPIWLKHGFTLSYGSEKSDLPDHYRVVCDCLHEGGHSTRHFLDGPADEKGIKGNPNKTPIQAVISTATYLRRALAVMIFDITITGADRDGQRYDEKITEEQRVRIQEWIAEKNVNVPRFMEWLGVEALADIPASKYQMAIDALRKK